MMMQHEADAALQMTPLGFLLSANVMPCWQLTMQTENRVLSRK
jgi:hypothetical protein